MKKTNIKKFVIISTSIVFAIIILLSFSFKKPFKDIEISSVKRISVYNYEGTNTTHELTDEQIKLLINSLNNIKIFPFPAFYYDAIVKINPGMEMLGGHTKMFQMELTDGTIIDFAVYGDYFVLNGKKYDTTNDIILDEIDNLYNDNTFQSN